MSTVSNTYLIWGVRLDYEKIKAIEGSYDILEPYFDQAHHEATNPKNSTTCLFDGRDGRYVIVGHVAAKSRLDHPLYEALSVSDLQQQPGNPGAAIEIGRILERLKIPESEQNQPGWHIITHLR